MYKKAYIIVENAQDTYIAWWYNGCIIYQNNSEIPEKISTIHKKNGGKEMRDWKRWTAVLLAGSLAFTAADDISWYITLCFEA